MNADTLGHWLADNADVPLLERHLLAGHCLNLSRAAILAHPERPLPGDQRCVLDAAAARWRDGEPMAYIAGSKEFWSLDLRVTPAVLIPRPETELLVELAVARLRERGNQRPQRVLDLGTGSGAVIIALAHEFRTDAHIEFVATDISAEALAVARDNAHRHGVRVRMHQADWFAGCDGTWDVIVSNPPYVADGDTHLAALQHEPQGALVAGEQGLDDLARIIAAAPRNLNPAGYLFIEHGAEQGPAVRDLLVAAGLGDVHTHPDLAGLPRVSQGSQHG